MGVLKMPMHLFFVRKLVIVGQKSNVDMALDANVGVLFLVANVQRKYNPKLLLLIWKLINWEHIYKKIDARKFRNKRKGPLLEIVRKS